MFFQSKAERIKELEEENSALIKSVEGLKAEVTALMAERDDLLKKIEKSESTGTFAEIIDEWQNGAEEGAK